ncbi:hypothetical protein GUJ93_ZPchr0001g32792 [Zizania palustris]|uniref:Uncharacterized protein n=1 Tax=Zizania palustris TaxID=103762 RepID=A0A8J5V955_ZIZPA|nr:hypothetical protein GUJ93_ZPchr0001g32792 [Zizania palustris]
MKPPLPFSKLLPQMGNKGEFMAGDEPIRPPPLKDAGLEDRALLPEPIAEAFLLTAKAVSSRLAHFSFFDDSEYNDSTFDHSLRTWAVICRR